MLRLHLRCLGFFLACFVEACTTIPKSRLLVPSHTTVGKLEALSRQSGAIVDVLTVKREEQVLILEGSGAGSLSGKAIDTVAKNERADRFTIPFDELAAVYYTGPTKDIVPIALRLPLKETYPKLPVVGATEQSMTCAELDTELKRADAVRWFARREGALPFTAHQQRVQHAKNAAIDIGLTLVAVAALAGGAGGGSGPVVPPDQATRGLTDQVGAETLRWAITSADQRLLGLLQIKRDRQCPAATTPAGEGTDLAILEQIDATRDSLDAGKATDQEQLDRQTQLLDMLDRPAALARCAADAAAGGCDSTLVTSLTRISSVVWIPNLDATNMHFKDYANFSSVKGTLVLGEHDLVLNPDQQGMKLGNLRIDYADISKVEVKRHWLNCAVVISHVDGRIDSLQVVPGIRVNVESTNALGEQLRSKLPTPSPSRSESRDNEHVPVAAGTFVSGIGRDVCREFKVVTAAIAYGFSRPVRPPTAAS